MWTYLGIRNFAKKIPYLVRFQHLIWPHKDMVFLTGWYKYVYEKLISKTTWPFEPILCRNDILMVLFFYGWPGRYQNCLAQGIIDISEYQIFKEIFFSETARPFEQILWKNDIAGPEKKIAHIVQILYPVLAIIGHLGAIGFSDRLIYAEVFFSETNEPFEDMIKNYLRTSTSNMHATSHTSLQLAKEIFLLYFWFNNSISLPWDAGTFWITEIWNN